MNCRVLISFNAPTNSPKNTRDKTFSGNFLGLHVQMISCMESELGALLSTLHKVHTCS